MEFKNIKKEDSIFSFKETNIRGDVKHFKDIEFISKTFYLLTWPSDQGELPKLTHFRDQSPGIMRAGVLYITGTYLYSLNKIVIELITNLTFLVHFQKWN